VIVRIATEGQYELPDSELERLNELDNQVVEAVQAGDAELFESSFRALIDLVRANGRELDGDALVESQVIIPPSDTTMAEAEADFTGEGIIPESVLPGSA
jgi:hypothetical protein